MFTSDKSERRLRNMAEMMNKLGMDTAALARSPVGFTSAVSACQSCFAEEVCHDWLARASKPLAQAPEFCPNAKLFAQVRSTQRV
jgi:hypothetical protein